MPGQQTMINITLATLAVALALAPLAMAAEGDSDKDDDAGVNQPTMRELANKIDSAVRDIRGVQTTVGNLRTELGALSSTVAANHATIVGKFAQQMAVVMTVPTRAAGLNAELYLVGDSTIPGFPAGTMAANGKLANSGQSATLPAGTYLFELQNPYSDNVVCHGNVSRRRGFSSFVRSNVCPRLIMLTRIASGIHRLSDGSGIYTYAEPSYFRPVHKFPTGLTFTDDRPIGSYIGSVKITKLK